MEAFLRTTKAEDMLMCMKCTMTISSIQENIDMLVRVPMLFECPQGNRHVLIKEHPLKGVVS